MSHNTNNNFCTTLELSFVAFTSGKEMLPPNDPALISMTMEALNFDKDAVVCWDPAKRQKKFRNLVLEETVWAKMPAMKLA